METAQVFSPSEGSSCFGARHDLDRCPKGLEGLSDRASTAILGLLMSAGAKTTLSRPPYSSCVITPPWKAIAFCFILGCCTELLLLVQHRRSGSTAAAVATSAQEAGACPSACKRKVGAAATHNSNNVADCTCGPDSACVEVAWQTKSGGKHPSLVEGLQGLQTLNEQVADQIPQRHKDPASLLAAGKWMSAPELIVANHKLLDWTAEDDLLNLDFQVDRPARRSVKLLLEPFLVMVSACTINLTVSSHSRKALTASSGRNHPKSSSEGTIQEVF
ncbi:hypothetical protein WJX79_009741 [Trebouxia sp. C0005]